MLKNNLSEANISKTGGTPINLRATLLKMCSGSVVSNETDVDDHEDESSGRNTPHCFGESYFNVSRDINTPTRKAEVGPLFLEFPSKCEEDNIQVSRFSTGDESYGFKETKRLTTVLEQDSEMMVSHSADESNEIEERRAQAISSKLRSKEISSDTLLDIPSNEEIREILEPTKEEQKVSEKWEELSQSNIVSPNYFETTQNEVYSNNTEFRDFEMEIDYKSKEIYLISNNSRLKMLCWENFPDLDQMQAALTEMLFNIQANC